jgi:hypothetical protein
VDEVTGQRIDFTADPWKVVRAVDPEAVELRFFRPNPAQICRKLLSAYFTALKVHERVGLVVTAEMALNE